MPLKDPKLGDLIYPFRGSPKWFGKIVEIIRPSEKYPKLTEHQFEAMLVRIKTISGKMLEVEAVEYSLLEDLVKDKERDFIEAKALLQEAKKIE